MAFFGASSARLSEVTRWDGGAYPLYDFTASGMAHLNPDYAEAPNSYRVTEPFVEPSIGLLEINRDTRLHPTGRMQALGVHGRSGFEQEVSLGDLQ